MKSKVLGDDFFTPEPPLECLLDLAEAVCEEIEAFAPDLLVALYHSGQGPLWAASALWAETRRAPFPPVVRPNLGREKVARYDALREEMGWMRLLPEANGDWELAHCLAWLHEQGAWRQELRRQVAAALGKGVGPGRVLVIDDFLYEGTTWVLALGLFHSLYPASEARFMAGQLDGWQGSIAQMWLNRYYPGVNDRLSARDRAERHRGIQFRCGTCLRRMVMGTEDLDDGESLAWRPITIRSEVVRRLDEFLPAREWLELPSWARATVEAFVRRRACQLPRMPAAWRQGTDHKRRINRVQLSPAQLVLTQAWLRQPITLSSAMELCRLSESQAIQLLEGLVARKYLLQHGSGPEAGYVLCPGRG